MLSRLKTRLIWLFQRSHAEKELEAELLDHLDQQTEQNVRLGMDTDEARHAARKAFGGVEQAKERSRDAHGLRWVEEVRQDLRYGARTLLRNPGFTLTAVITLALGIGANTAIFSLVNTLLLRPLPYRQPEQLVRVTSDLVRRNAVDVGVDASALEDLSARAGIFTEVCGLYPINANLTGSSEPERIEGVFVSPNYFTLLGAEAALGRVFNAANFRSGDSEIVISDSLWRRQFGGDPKIIGKTVRLDNDLTTILGVMPPAFRHPGRGMQGDVELWQPSDFRASSFQAPARGVFIIRSGALARLKPGVAAETAQRQLNALSESLKRENSKEYPDYLGWSLRLIPLQTDLVGKARTALFILLGAVGFVLLIACANVANLLLTRATARRREFAIRAALGAGRLRLIRQLLTESLLLSFIGAGLGLLLTVRAMDSMTRLLPADISRTAKIGVDSYALLFTLVLCIVTCLIFAVAPAISITRLRVESLKDASNQMTAGKPRNGLRNLLVVSEIALALVLLIGAGLLTRSFWRLLSADPGFNPEGVLTARLWMSLPNNPQTGPYFLHDKRVSFYRSTLDRIARLPGVESAAWSNQLPLDGPGRAQPFWIEGRPIETAQVSTAEPFYVGPGYFQTLQISLVKGRYLNDYDDEKAPGVTLISQSLADRFFPGEEPLGKRIRPGGVNSTAPWIEIVGVVRDVKSGGLEAADSPQLYRSLLQRSWLSSALIVRSAVDPDALKEMLRREIRAEDPDIPIFGVRTMNEMMSAATAQKRFAMLLLGLFAIVALLLAAVGVYGVMAYMVEQRTREIGVRLALGAEKRDILRLVLVRGLSLILWGSAVGVLASLSLTRFLSSLLFKLSETDPLTFLSITLFLAATAIGACWIPARRAMKVDPIVALRRD
jgi:predicted permease